MGIFDWLFPKRTTERGTPLYFFNTLGKEKQLFSPLSPNGLVRMYNCGPTVYDRQHIGNLSAAIFADTIRRALILNDYTVKQVINITDFGHLVSDADEGEDKMAKALKRDKLKFTMENMREIATKYMDLYLEDIKRLNLITEAIQFPRASDYVPGMIAMIQTLEEKGYAYKTSDGVYFDTARFQGYGALGGVDTASLKAGARVAVNPEKHNPTDFALWKFNPKLGWNAPWGKGFPGWHLECSAMINSVLGKQIDIHTGGIEHIAIHHNNEIAQSEAATGKKPLSRFWLHRAHIQMGNAKLAKSSGNTAYLSDVIEKGFHPLALRYWFLTSHYRQSSNFTWEALEAAQKAFLRLHEKMQAVKKAQDVEVPESFKKGFFQRLNDDLDTPAGLAFLWENLKNSDYSEEEIKSILVLVDQAFGIGLRKPDELLLKLLEKTMGKEVSLEELPSDIQTLLKDRESSRAAKDWDESDRIRNVLMEKGYRIEDAANRQRIIAVH